MPILMTLTYAAALRVLVGCYPFVCSRDCVKANNEIQNRLFKRRGYPFHCR